MRMIYPINQQIEQLLFENTDDETGELKCSDEAIQEAISQLEMEYDDKITALRNSYLETELNAKLVDAQAKTLRDEAEAVQKRANSMHNKADSIKRFIAYLLNGEKFDKNGCKITYKKSEQCVVDDDFIVWAKTNRPELLTMKARLKDITTAIKSGDAIKFAHIEERRNIQVK